MRQSREKKELRKPIEGNLDNHGSFLYIVAMMQKSVIENYVPISLELISGFEIVRRYSSFELSDVCLRTMQHLVIYF